MDSGIQTHPMTSKQQMATTEHEKVFTQDDNMDATDAVLVDLSEVMDEKHDMADKK